MEYFLCFCLFGYCLVFDNFPTQHRAAMESSTWSIPTKVARILKIACLFTALAKCICVRHHAYEQNAFSLQAACMWTLEQSSDSAFSTIHLYRTWTIGITLRTTEHPHIHNIPEIVSFLQLFHLVVVFKCLLAIWEYVFSKSFKCLTNNNWCSLWLLHDSVVVWWAYVDVMILCQ